MDNATKTLLNSEKAHVDRRVVRTRKAIKAAFEKLLGKQRIDKITVSAIAREADIDRKTFYLHYATIDDLIRDIASDNIHDIEELIESEGQDKSAQECVHIILAAIDRTIMSNLSRYENIVANLSIDQILERIEAHGEYLLAQVSVQAGTLPPDADPKRLHMTLRFCLAGALSLYTEWLASDRTAPIESVSDIVESVLFANLFGQKDGARTAAGGSATA